MAILIVNVSEDYGIPYGTGVQKYELRINHKVLCEFEHVYEDRMATCLRLAAVALEKEEKLGE